MTIQKSFHEPTIDDLHQRWRRGRLNLSPAFQRESVWSEQDRRELIVSLLLSVPIPSVFLYKRGGRGGIVEYDVIDGKQRLETILLFMGTGPLASDHEELWVKTALGDDADADWWSWGTLNSAQRHAFRSTNIQTVEVDGDLSDIVDLFVRINSTGKRLTAQERRHARYFTSDVLRIADRLADKEKAFLIRHGVVSRGQVARMKHVELAAELLISAHLGAPLDKKRRLDSVLSADGAQDATALRIAERAVQRSMRTVALLLPDLKTTRFHRQADFYTLTLLIDRLVREDGVMMRAGTRMRLAGALLREFGSQVDEAGERQRLGRSQSRDLVLAADYLSTVRAGTDSARQRRRRAQILATVLDGVFTERDPQRGFNAAQRRLVWHASSKKICSICRRRIESWNDMDVDHVRPHARGGRTNLGNAAIAHRRCNQSKGGRRVPVRKAAGR